MVLGIMSFYVDFNINNVIFWYTVTFGLYMDLNVYIVIFWSVSLSLHMDFTVNSVTF